MDNIKRELDKAITDLKEAILRAVDVAYHEGCRDGCAEVMATIQAIIDDDGRRPS